MTPELPLIEAAREVSSAFSSARLEAVIIGGLANFRWGEPRVTRDVDFTVLCSFGDEEETIRAILDRLQGRIDNPHEFAVKHRVVLAKTSNGVPIDISLGALPFEGRAVERGSVFAFLPGTSLRTCSAEDLVIMKAYAGRDRDLLDLKGILVRQAGHLDWSLIENELKPLLELKGNPEMWDQLLKLRAAVSG